MLNLKSAASVVARFDLLKETILSAVAAAPAAGDTPLPPATSAAARRLFPRRMVAELWERQGGACALCGQGIDAARRGEWGYAQIDHAVPFAGGGRTEAANAQLVHAACNRSKGARSAAGSTTISSAAETLASPSTNDSGAGGHISRLRARQDS